MGTTYSNCQICSDSQDAVADALKPLLKEPAYVSPSVGGWVGVYPEGGATDTLAEILSAELSCPAFSWNAYDSDVFYYTLYENGEVRDEFNSDPDYFENQRADGDESEDDPVDPVRVQGSPEVLLPLCVPGITLAAVQAVLHPATAAEDARKLITFSPVSNDQYLFADQQARELAQLLGIDSSLASLGYSYIEAGETHEYTLANFPVIKPSTAKAQTRRPAKSQRSPNAASFPEQRDELGVPTLVTAAHLCRPDLVRELLSSGYDANLAVDASPLRSQQKRNPAIADVLASMIRQRFGNIYETGMTALIVAAGRATDDPVRQGEIVQVLLDAGADVHARSETGRTALSEATNKNTEVVEMLRAAGATE